MLYSMSIILQPILLEHLLVNFKCKFCQIIAENRLIVVMTNIVAVNDKTSSYEAFSLFLFRHFNEEVLMYTTKNSSCVAP